jgi:predicted ATP-dependent serine protease
MTENTLTELELAAIKYAEAGWCVLPLADYQKNPSSLLSKWSIYQTQKPTYVELKTWFSNPRVTGIALVCGEMSGVMVVDDDSYKTGNPLSLHSSLETRTASGGRHLFFKHNPIIGNRNVRTNEHEFEIQCDRKLIVLPPSRAKNKKNEIGQYQWSVGSLAEIKNLPEIPKQFIKQYTTKLIDRPHLSELVEAPLGTQHNNLRDMTHIILRSFPQKDWRIACDVIRTLASKFDPPHPTDRVEQMIEDCKQFRIEHALNGRNSDFLHRDEFGMTTDLNQEGEQNKRSVTIDFEPILLRDISEEEELVQWVWDGYVARGCTTLLSALPKAGKTTLISQMLQKVETGGELAGMKIHPSKVLILTEESKAKWGARRDIFNLPLTSISIVSRPMNKKYNYSEWVAALARAAEICEEQGIQICVIDTLTTFWNARDENDAAKVIEALLPIFQLVKKDVGVLIVHHDRKSGGENGTAARGSNALTGFVDIIIELNRLTDSPTPTRRVLKTLSRFEESPHEVVIDLIDGRYETLGDKSEVHKQQKLTNLVNFMALMGKEVTISDIIKEWDVGEFGSKPSRSTLQRYLSTLIEQNKVTISGEVIIKKKKTPTYMLNSEHEHTPKIDF